MDTDLVEAYRHRLVLISPPRTGSTVVARLLWQHELITHHCHEPFEACYWGGQGAESVAACLGNPMEVATGDRVRLADVPRGSGLLVKEMSFQLATDQFDELAGTATAPLIFVMSDPRLSTTSRLRIVRELSEASTFPPFESGWPSLAEQVARCRERGIPYVLLDSDDLRADPAGLTAALMAAVGLPEQAGLESWSPRPGLQLCSPEVGALMSDVRRADDPFYRKVLGSTGIQPRAHVDWDREEALISAAGLAGAVETWLGSYRELQADPGRLGVPGHTPAPAPRDRAGRGDEQPRGPERAAPASRAAGGSASGCVDVIGVGFGPANLSLAIALQEESPQTSAVFLEAETDPVWQGAMLLDGSNMQNHPSRDLVTLRNPRSHYSFVNYLFEQGRLVEHLNLPMEFPLRKEYAHYIRWAADQFRDQVELGVRVTGIAIAEVDGAPAYAVTGSDGVRRYGRSLVLGTGRTPFVPKPFDTIDSPRVVHLTRYLPAVRALAERPPRSIAVIGGSQSAVEIVLDLAVRFPQARIVDYVRGFGLPLKDTSPFSEEGFFPGFTDYYYRSSRPSKDILDAYMRRTNYSSVDADVLHELYVLIYEQRLDGDQRVFVLGNREVRAAQVEGTSVRLEVEEVHNHEVVTDRADLVVLATGFRDLGPHPDQEPSPAVLDGVAGRFQFDADGYLVVEPDYRLRPLAESTPPLFLNGLCESSHGIGDAGSFSLLSLRAATIIDGLRKEGIT
ncbi:lysine N(6)-hydroxylase/L-ornithine N(5)-oxygenase family protein [Amycolatopsis sp. MtRt-6]|uniref:lysine N(6)-hydroxylase/L-ornithine N(5)-oxygenase family protein n=1 Tax=Amycolatopsis sp. MtRt-6 TaxID=2792782 RepID=UPI001F5D996F|nr:SidA/IucD/PvdA family monooxygenase [Amycolatopsis sp. MtRt-6]